MQQKRISILSEKLLANLFENQYSADRKKLFILMDHAFINAATDFTWKKKQNTGKA